MRAIRDEETAGDIEARYLQTVDFLEKGNRIENHAIADHAAATFTQHAARNELEHEFLTADNDGVTRIVSASIPGDDIKVLREHVDDLALALIAPLGAHNNRCIASFQRRTPEDASEHTPAPALGAGSIGM